MHGKFMLWIASGRDDMDVYLKQVREQIPKRLKNVAVYFLGQKSSLRSKSGRQASCTLSSFGVPRPSNTDAVPHLLSFVPDWHLPFHNQYAL